jgi:predicted esterase
MEISENTIKVEKTAHYFTLGNSKQNKHLYLFHGYAQNAKDFVHQFDYLAEDYFLISIEGLSAFYAKGVFGEVGYSWMTKENRENEINDYLKMINKIKSEVSINNERIYALGFSQGSQTASRWVNVNTVEKLILCGGLVPKDCNQLNSTVNLIIGDDDKFINKESFLAFKNSSPDFHYHPFQGKHIVHHETVKSILLDD